MSDVIEQLRDAFQRNAAEIEGLQAKVKELARLMRTDVDTIKQQAAEIERLTAREKTLYNTAKINLKVAQDRGAEIEQLTAALQQIVERYQTAEDGWPAEDMRTMASRALEQRP